MKGVPELNGARAAALLALALAAGCASVQQAPDDSFEPMVERPRFVRGDGPRVSIDEGHCNFHTAGGRFGPFAALLRADGFEVSPLAADFSAAALEGTDLLVIANAMSEEGCDDYDLPTAAAFRAEEIDAVVAWVESGGALLLIADHMPFAGAAADLAKAFGVLFINGYARPEAGGPIRFGRAAGTLLDHAVTRGRDAEEAIDHVASFTGQGFRVLREVAPLLVLPGDTTLYLPAKHGTFTEKTPRLSAEGLLQGAVLTHGGGRVGVFGEAGMFSAQSYVADGVLREVGMNAPEADENAQFTLNLARWLVGALDSE